MIVKSCNSKHTMKKVTLSIIRSALALILGAPGLLLAQSEFSDGIAGYWPLDSDLIDASATGGDGSYVGNGTLTFTTSGVAGSTAKFGEAISLNSANVEYVSIDGAGNGGFQGEDFYDFSGDDLTISTWFTVAPGGLTTSWQGLIAKGEGSGWRIARNAENPRLDYAGGLGDTGANATSDITAGLHHVTAVTDSQRGTYIYIDGVLEAHNPGTPVLEDRTNFMTIGNNGDQLERAWNGTIDDVLIFNRPLSGPEVRVIYNSGVGTLGQDIIDSTDTDSDGMPDFYETANGLNIAIDDASADPDTDNLSNIDEYRAGLDPNNNDTDGDNLLDGEEAVNNADPFIADTDGDGLSDGDEVNIHMTLPDNIDSDGDQANDLDEINAGTDPNNINSIPSSWRIGLTGYWSFDDTLDDTSGTEAHGTFQTNGENPLEYGTAKFGNGVVLDSNDLERVEIDSVPESTFDFTGGSVTISTWASVAEFTSNWQGMIAKGEGTSWRIARRNNGNDLAYNPGEWKAGGDDLSSGVNINDGALHHVVAITDANGTGQLWIDGVKTIETTAAPVIGNSTFNLLIGGNPEGDPIRTWSGTLDDVAIWNRPITPSEIGQIYSGGEGRSIQSLIDDPDTDGDGLPDSWELANMTDRLTPDADEDPDMDMRTNIQEFTDASDPQDPDTDGDDLNDGEEVTAMSDPLNPDSDRDGLLDGAEVKIHLTSPILPDTDMDGFSDSVEIEYGTIPTDDTSFPKLADGLLGYWPLDLDLQDDTGDGGNGSYRANTFEATPTYVEGQFGNGILLDSTDNQYVEIDGAGQTPPDYTQAGASVSISVWTKVDTFTQNWQGLVARGEGSAWRIANRGIGGEGQNAAQIAFAGGGVEPFGGPAVDDGLFHHIVAVTEHGLGARLYIDGVQVADSGTSAPELTDNGGAAFVAIGSNPGAITRSWDGVIDDVAIWTRPLSATEVSGLFTATESLGEQLGIGGPPGPPTITTHGRDGANYVLTAVNLIPTKTYILERSTDLQDWLEVEDGRTGSEENFFTDLDPLPLPGEAFYRINEEQ